MTSTPRKVDRTTILIALLSLAGCLVIILSTRWGPWAYSDSTEYIVSARTLLAGKGLGIYTPTGTFKPLSLHPPLYPLLLSAFGFLGIEMLDAARWLNVLFFGGTIFLASWFVHRLFHSAWLTVLTGLAVLTMPGLVDVFSGAMTEPLFFLAATLSLGLLAIALSARQETLPASSNRLILFSALAASAASLVRYPGIALAAAGLVGLLCFNHAPLKARLRQCLVFGAVSLLPTAAWLAWVYAQTRTISSRNFHIPANLWETLTPLRLQFAEVLWGWLPFTQFLPVYSYKLARNLLLGLGFLFILAAALSIWKQARQDAQSAGKLSPLGLWVGLWFAFIAAYLALLVYTFISTTPTPDIINRTLLPVQFGLLFIVLPIGRLITQAWGQPGPTRPTQAKLRLILPVAAVGAALVFIASNSQASWQIASAYYRNGGGFTSLAWQHSLTLQALHGLPANIPIISNRAPAVLLLANRPAYDFCGPTKDPYWPCYLESATRYGDLPDDEVQRVFRETGAALVIFYPYCAPGDSPWSANVLAQLNMVTQGLEVYTSSCNGAIFFYPRPEGQK